MNFDPKYTIHYRTVDLSPLRQGDTIVYWSNGVCCGLWGDYCQWPKQEPRRFVVMAGLTNSPEFIEKCNREYTDEMFLKDLNKDLKKKPIKFYHQLNNKYNSKRYVTSKKG